MELALFAPTHILMHSMPTQINYTEYRNSSRRLHYSYSALYRPHTGAITQGSPKAHLEQ